MCVKFQVNSSSQSEKSRLYAQLQGQHIPVEIGLANLKYKNIIKVNINLTKFI